MEKASSRVIEVTVITGEDLRVNRRNPVKKNAFVIVRSDPLNAKSTGMNTDGGCNPIWNEKLVMDLPMHANFITVEVHSGSKIIGIARIPLSDFMGGYLPANYLSFLSYRLRDDNGEKNGIINLAVKVSGQTNMSCAASCSRPWFGGPMNEKVSNGTVTGIPVSYGI
ncbi:BON1-associated protein 2-like [Olea europaea var. sylvestris]|uniref:BON1-associated protein 2-like n=1 Tax=Olea europaea var. sylvestris TaxID=158386 RepID=UPI000C1D219D|nr:BON1-associated protein 2-like [Olea europaea var. sylvestris]